MEKINNMNENKEGVKFTEMYVVRHGETEAKANPIENGGPLVSGRLNTPLTENGKKGMFEVGENNKNVQFDAVYVSPLLRSHQSAENFLKGAGQENLIENIKEDVDLLEINYGPHEGMPASEVDKIKKEFFGTEEGKAVDGLGYKFPGSHSEFGEQESFREGADRYSKALEKIAADNPGKNVLIISHSGVMRALQLCGKIESAGAAIGKDLKFGEVIKIKSDGSSLELDQ